MITTYADMPARNGPVINHAAVVWLDWPDYLKWLSGKKTHQVTAWGERVRLPAPPQPGQHTAMIGPTGEGKTTFAVGTLALRNWVLALDPKGEDDTLAASGYERVLSIPPHDWSLRSWGERKQWRDIDRRTEASLPARLIVGGASRTDDDDMRLQALMHQAITYCRHTGGWTLYVDEFELLSSQRMFNLGRFIERMLITARRDKTSVITSFQAAAWVSKHATRQARFCAMWPTGDRDMIKSVANSMGRDWQQIAEIVDMLERFHVAVIPRGKLGGPVIITSPPKVA